MSDPAINLLNVHFYDITLNQFCFYLSKLKNFSNNKELIPSETISQINIKLLTSQFAVWMKINSLTASGL